MVSVCTLHLSLLPFQCMMLLDYRPFFNKSGNQVELFAHRWLLISVIESLCCIELTIE